MQNCSLMVLHHYLTQLNRINILSHRDDVLTIEEFEIPYFSLDGGCSYKSSLLFCLLQAVYDDEDGGAMSMYVWGLA